METKKAYNIKVTKKIKEGGEKVITVSFPESAKQLLRRWVVKQNSKHEKLFGGIVYKRYNIKKIVHNEFNDIERFIFSKDLVDKDWEEVELRDFVGSNLNSLLNSFPSAIAKIIAITERYNLILGGKNGN